MNKPKTISEFVYEEIKSNILAGEYVPGQKLTETFLASELDVSRTPIRDALHRLEAEELITSTPHKGITVAKFSLKKIQDFYQTRVVLEGLAAKLAAMNATEEELVFFKEKVNKMQETFHENKDSITYKEIAKQNNEFHKIICKMAKNDVLTKMIKSLENPITVVRSTAWTAFKNRKIETMEEHMNIANAILNRDEELAKEKAEYHIFNAWKCAENALEDQQEEAELEQ